MFQKDGNVFIEKNLDFLMGQSDKMKHFAEKSIESLATVEVSPKAKNEVVEQSKCLCEDYIYNRLAMVLHSQQERFIYQTIAQQQQPVEQQNSTSSNNSTSSINDNVFFRSISRLFSSSITDQPTDIFFRSTPDKVGIMRFEKWRNRIPDVTSEIISMGQKLEHSYPFLYDNISRQLKMPLKSEAAIVKALTCIGDCMFENNFVTWYRIVAMFAIAGAVALETIDNKKGNLITCIVHVFSQIMERHTAHWICSQGGWVAIIKNYQPVDKTYQKFIKFFGFLFGFWVVMLLPVHFFK